MDEKQKYLVTRVETAIISARSEDEAKLIGLEAIAYGFSDTTDVAAEELDGER